MNKDIITLYDENNQKKEYKLLLVIDKEFKYLVYTDSENNDISKNLYAVKIKELKSNEEILPINDDEWEMIETKYKELIKV